MKLLLMCFVMLGLSASLNVVQSNDKNEQIRLSLKVNQRHAREVELEATSRSELAMLFMPTTELYMRTQLKGIMKLIPSEDSNNVFYEKNIIEEAKVEYYTSGEPNQKLPEDVVDKLLWKSGLAPKGHTTKRKIDQFGKIIDISYVPEQYISYFENSVLYYPDKKISVGDKWHNSFEHSLSLDFSQPSLKTLAEAEYELITVDKDRDLASIKVKISFELCEGDGSETPQFEKFDIRQLIEMQVNISDGMVVKSRTTQNALIMFSENNYIKSEDIHLSKSSKRN